MPRLLDDTSDPRWLEAERRVIFLRALLKGERLDGHREDVEAVHNEFRIGRSTVYRMIARFRASRKASSLIPAGLGTADGALALRYQDRTPHRPTNRSLLAERRKAEDALVDPTSSRSLSDRGNPAVLSEHHQRRIHELELAVEAVRSQTRKKQMTDRRCGRNESMIAASLVGE
jgi:DnaJ-domain-containing protein 1